MTEREQALAHLRKCQAALAHARSVSVFEQGSWWPQDLMTNTENRVLAALSWLWDAQERERERVLTPPYAYRQDTTYWLGTGGFYELHGSEWHKISEGAR
jgi:hypothetical protein